MKEIEEKLNKIKKEQDKLREFELLQNYEGEDRVISSEDAWKGLEEERKKPVQKFFSKIPSLDRILDGFREGDLVVISGSTKQGKTTLAQTFTTGLAEAEVPCLWFSYELTQREFLEKFTEPLPYFTLPRQLKGNNLDWIEQRVVESQAKYGTKVVFIDHLHFLVDMSFIGQRGNVSLLIGSIMRKLKQIALKRSICIILVAHTRKIAFDREPDLEDIRDSSFISQEADTVLMIWRLKEKREFNNEARLAVLANRRSGKVGKIDLQLKNKRFYEQDNLQ